MKTRLLVCLIVLISANNLLSQVPFPTGPRDYNEIEPWGYQTVGTNWNTSKFLPFIYKNVWFRLMPPNGVTYNSATQTWTFSNPTQKYPIIFFQYGAGEAGTDNNNQLKHGGQRHMNAVTSGEFPGFLLYPQLESPAAIGGDLANELLQKLMSELPIDVNRIYMHGLSNGARATWDCAIRYPTLFAAIAPMSGVLQNSYQSSLIYTPIRLSQGGLDKNPNPSYSGLVRDQYDENGGQLEYLYFPNNGHDTWNAMYNRTDFFTWFLSQKKNKIFARYKKSEFCPGETVSATLGLTPGFDGYEWRKDGNLISGATGNTITVSVFGSYSARFRRGSVWTDWSDPIVVKIKDVTQTPPISVTGIKSVVLPAPDGSTTVPLELPEGYATYGWFKDGSPISSERTIVATSGTYTAIVSEFGGCSSNQSAPFAVLNAGGSNAPDPASGLVGFAISKTSIRLNWSENPNAQFNETGFEVYRGMLSTGPFTLMGISGQNVLTFTDNNLNPNTQYFYFVRAINGFTSSSNTAVVSIRTQVDNLAPSAPANLRVTFTSENSITLAWDASTDDVGVVGYDVYRDGVKSIVSPTTSVTVYNLQNETVYRFTVKARDFAGNISPSSNQAVGAAVRTGLSYKYYHGSFSTLPNFNSLIPVSTGATSNVNISVRTQNDNFAFMWEGYIYIPVAGNYTFETRSDDGSKLYIGSYNEANLVVNNDGLHGAQYREGIKNFASAGAYPIVVTYFERTGGGELMQVYWKNTASGIGSTRQLIPDNAFRTAFQIPSTVPLKPTNLAGVGTSYDKIDLAWQDNSSDEVAYQIYRAASAPGQIFLPVGMVSPNANVYSDNGLLPSANYLYQVISLGTNGQSGVPSNPVMALGPIKYGINAIDNATGTGYIMYSVQSLFSRFTSNRPNSNNSDNVISVKYNTGTNRWQYDNGSSLINFTPVATDVLLASVNFSTDVVTSLQGQNYTFQGIQAGYTAGDLTFLPNRWNNANDAGEFTVTGTWFQRNNPDVVRVTTQPAPSIPIAPILSISDVGAGAVTLSWIDNSSNENYFVIQRSSGNNSNYLNIATVTGSSLTSGTYVDDDVFANLTYYYKIEAVNAGGKSTSNEASVSTLNNVPEISSQTDIIMRYDGQVLIDLFAQDLDGEQLTLTGINLPTFITLENYGDGTGLLTIQPSITDQGVYLVRVEVTDGHGGMDFMEFNLTINDNYPPELSGIANVTMNEGATRTLNLVATDQNGSETLNWELLGLPPFGTFTHLPNGTATITFAPNYTDGGLYNLDLKLSDGAGGEIVTPIVLNVSDVNPSVEVLVNFSAGSNAPTPWNNIKTLTTTNLLNKQGSGSGIGLSFPYWKAFTDGAQTGNNSGIYPDIVLKEYYYFGIFGAPNTINFTVNGLDPTRKYDFSFMGSSVWPNVANNGTTIYTIGGQSVSLAVQGNTSQNATLSNIMPSSSGIVTVTLTKGASTSVGYLNALEVKSLYGANEVPASPRKLKAELLASGNGLLTWVDAPYNETGYEVYRSGELGGAYSLLATLAANSTSYEDSGIEQENAYFYKVRSINVNGPSEYTDEVGLVVPNIAPKMAIVGSTALGLGVESEIIITLTDPPLNEVDLEVSGLPSFGSVQNNLNGSWTLTFNPTLQDIGSYDVTVIGSDNSGNEVSQVLSLSVSEAVLYEVRLNFGSNISSSGLWNNTSKVPVLGDTFSNLKNTQGAVTTVDVQLQTAFGGYYSQGASTGNNSGVVPDDVLREYYWFGYYGAPSVVNLKVSGLSPYEKYTFKFIGSSVFTTTGITDNGSTIYSIGDKSASLYVQGNTSQFATIGNIRSDVNGDVVITMTKATGTFIGYINAMMIEAYELETEELDPTNLVAVGQSGAVSLSWADNAFDETGYEIYKSANENGPFNLLSSVATNQSTYTDFGVSGLGYYKVKGVFPGRESLFTNVASAGPIGFKVYVNFNGVAQYDAPVPWNNLSKAPVDDDVFIGFKDALGKPTGLRLNFLKNMEGHNDWGPTTGNNSGIYPDVVLKSFYWKNALVEPAKIRIENVDMSFAYNISFFGSIVSNFTVSTNFIIGDKTVTNNQNNNTTTPVAITGVLADKNGGIEITVNEGPGSPWAIFNAMVIEAYPTGDTEKEISSGARTTAYQGNTFEVRYGESSPVVTLYPNPVMSDLNIDYENVARGGGSLKITDIWGKEVYASEYQSDSLEGYKKISISDLGINAGMYILYIKFKDGKASAQRFIVIK